MRASVPVVGMVAGGRENIVFTARVGDPVLAVHDRSNAHDPNAIAVYTAPASILEDATYDQGRWLLSRRDRRVLADRQAGYLPARTAARLELGPHGTVGIITNVRLHPDTEVVAGFDVTADWPPFVAPKPTRYDPDAKLAARRLAPLDDGYDYG